MLRGMARSLSNRAASLTSQTMPRDEISTGAYSRTKETLTLAVMLIVPGAKAEVNSPSPSPPRLTLWMLLKGSHQFSAPSVIL